MILAICITGPIAHPSSAGTAAKIAVSQARPAIHDVSVGLQRAAERLRAHLADKMRSLVGRPHSAAPCCRSGSGDRKAPLP